MLCDDDDVCVVLCVKCLRMCVGVGVMLEISVLMFVCNVMFWFVVCVESVLM